MPSKYRATRTPGVQVAHESHCPSVIVSGARCRCQPSYRGRRRSPGTGKPEYSPASKHRAEVLTWLGASRKGRQAMAAHVEAGRTLQSLGDEWLAGAERGAIAKRRGKSGVGYAETTLAGYRRSWERVIKPEFGARPAAEIDAIEWQHWIDGMCSRGLSRARIANHVAVASAIYMWAARPNRRLVPGNPLRDVELPANDEKPRTRVAPMGEARLLLGALSIADRVPFGLAFFAGLRRSEIRRLEWTDVQLDGYRLWVRKSKSEAGTDRRPPIAEPLRTILLEEHLRQGRPRDGRVCAVSVMSGTLPDRARAAWAVAGLTRITLHECRHTYASFLMAAGYTLKEIMEYMGHADLQMVQRYTKLLPQPEERNPADRLNDYLRTIVAIS